MNPFYQALQSGYSIDQILDYLKKASPKIAKRISAAQQAGYGAEKIFNFLSDKAESDIGSNYMTSHRIEAKKKKEYEQKIGQGLKIGAGLGMTALSAYALGRALPKAVQAISGLANQAAPTSQTAQPATLSPQQAQAPSSPQAAPSQNAITPPSPPSFPDELFNALMKGKTSASDAGTSAFLKAMQKLKQSGQVNNREDFMRHYEAFKGDIAKGTDLPTAIGNIFGGADKEIPAAQALPNPAEENQKVEPLGQKANVPEAQPQIQGNLVLTPQGDVGEVESIKNGIAKVRIGEGFKTRKTQDLIPEPESIKNINFDDLALEYAKRLPESHKSRLFYLAQFIPRSEDGLTGDFMAIFTSKPNEVGLYSNVPKDFADKVIEGSLQAKTSGESLLGKHVKGEAPSRGAGITELKKYPYQKFNVGYKTTGPLLEAMTKMDKESRIASKKKENPKHEIKAKRKPKPKK